MKIMAIFILLATWTLSSLGDETLSSETPIAQTTCPVMIGNPIDPSLYVDHEGQRIYFCCKMCVQTFKENPAAYLPNLTNSNITNDQSVEIEDHYHETDHVALSNTSRLIRFLGKFHPVAVHIPIGLLLGALLAEGLFLCFRTRAIFRNAARLNLH
jgi:YHS domain-containing protein